MEIKKIVEGMTAKEVSSVIDHNFGEIVSEKADKSYVDEKLKNIVSGSVSGYKYLTSTDELPTEQTTIGYIIGNDMYLYVGEGGNTLGGLYQNVGPFKGEKGDTGERGADGIQGEKGEKGDKGEAGITSATIAVDDTTGIPSASVAIENQVLHISLSGIKGEQGNSGYQGAVGELEVVNNLTEGGAEKALSAEMGKQINETLSQFGSIVDGLEPKIKEIESIVGYHEKTDLTTGLSSGLIKTGTSVGETASLAKSSNSGWLSGIFELSEGSEVIITGTGSVSFRLYSIIDANNVVLQVSASEATATNQTVKIEQDCRIVVNFDKTKNYSLFTQTQGEGNIRDNIEAVEEKIDDVYDKINNLDKQINTTSKDLTQQLKKGYAINTGSTIGGVAPLNEISDSSYSSGIFDVFEGDTVYLYGIGGINLSRKYALIDTENKVLDISGADGESVQTPYETVVEIKQDCRIVVNLDVRSVVYSPSVVVKNDLSIDERISELDEKISELEESISKTEGTESEFIDITNTFNEGYGIKTGEAIGDIATLDEVANDDYKSSIITAAYGETYYITGKGGETTRLFALIDKNNQVLRLAGARVSVKDFEIIIERNCRLVVNSEKKLLKVVKKPKKEYIYHEVPDNIGLRNAVMNARQLINILYQTSAKMPSQGGTFNQGSWNKGMIYSSTRQEDLWVGNNVSFHTFLSALTSPNSYIYTINVANKYGLSNAACFYGTVCSQFVCYALGLKINYQTRQWRDIPGMVKVRNQSAYGLKIGDTFISGGKEVGVGSYSSGHCRICMDIVKNQDGIIQYVTVAESVQPKVISENYTAEQIDSWLSKDGYEIYRYEDAWKAKHTPSEYIPVADEDLASPMPFNANIMPRRGDKANWRNDEDVVIDILNKGTFTSYKLYKDDVLLSTAEVEGLVINLGVLPYGPYKLCLTDGSTDSGFVYFIVADYNVEAVSLGDGNVKISFSSANATPLWACWCVDREKFPTWSVPIDENAISNGFLITKYRTGNVWSFKVYFETDYGIICSDFVHCNVE